MSTDHEDRQERDGRARKLAGALAAALALLLLGLDLARRAGGVPDRTPPQLVVDPNNAPFEVLLALPRVGPALAQRIMTERERRPFDSIEDLDERVEGIGPSTLAALAPHLKIGPP